MPNWKKVITSGSDAQLGNVNTRSVTGSIGVQIGASIDVAHWTLAPNPNSPSSLGIIGHGGAAGFSYINTESLEVFDFQAAGGNTYINGPVSSLTITAYRTSTFVLTSGMNEGEYHGWKIHQSGSTTFGEPLNNDNHRYTFRDYSLNDILTIDTTTGSIGFRHSQYRNAPFLKVDSKGYVRSGSWSSVTASYVQWSNVQSKPSNLLSSSAQIAANISGAFASGAPVSWSAITSKPSGLVSGSSQVTFAGISGKPSGLVSGSTIPTASYVRKYSSVSGSATQTLNINKASRYFYTGSNNTVWTLPPVAGNSNVEFWIKNRGSGSINLVASGTNKIYDLTVVPSMSIYTGEAYVLYNDGTYWSVF